MGRSTTKEEREGANSRAKIAIDWLCPGEAAWVRKWGTGRGRWLVGGVRNHIRHAVGTRRREGAVKRARHLMPARAAHAQLNFGPICGRHWCWRRTKPSSSSHATEGRRRATHPPTFRGCGRSGRQGRVLLAQATDAGRRARQRRRRRARRRQEQQRRRRRWAVGREMVVVLEQERRARNAREQKPLEIGIRLAISGGSCR